MTEIGRVYVKIAGRDAGKFCTIVETIDNNFVMVDGQVRRKKCNLMHLEPLEKTIDVKKGASHSDVVKAFEKIGIKVITTKPKTKKGRPVRQRKQKQAQAPEQKQAKTAEKKVETKPAKKEAKK